MSRKKSTCNCNIAIKIFGNILILSIHDYKWGNSIFWKKYAFHKLQDTNHDHAISNCYYICIASLHDIKVLEFLAFLVYVA